MSLQPEPQVTMKYRRALIAFRRLEQNRKYFENAQRHLDTAVEALNATEARMYAVATGAAPKVAHREPGGGRKPQGATV